MKKRKFNHLMAAGVMAACAAGPSAAWAQVASWPSKPVRILVGFPAGSTPDSAARTLADGLSKVLGQPVVVENKAGASGNIAADWVAKATDDHTLGVLINGNLTSAKLLYPQLPYNPARDFALLSLIATSPLALVGAASVPDGADFFSAAVKGGDRWNYGSVGNGSVAHLGMELLKSKVKGLNPLHVPFQGNPAVVTGLLGGQIQMALVPPGLVMPHVKAGKLKMIGLTGGRSALAPEVLSLADLGVRDVNLEVWTALVGPAKLSKAAQDRLSREVPALLKQAETRQRLFNQGWQAVGTSPEGLRSRVTQEAALLGGIIKAAGVKLE